MMTLTAATLLLALNADEWGAKVDRDLAENPYRYTPSAPLVVPTPVVPTPVMPVYPQPGGTTTVTPYGSQSPQGSCLYGATGTITCTGY